MRRLLLIILGVVIAGGVLVISLVPGLFGPRTPPVLPDTTVRVVAALGRIRPEGGTIDVGADAMRRVGYLLVEEGQLVKKGDILAYLDNHEEMKAATAYAEAQLAGGKTQFAQRTALEQANIAKVEAELKSIEELTPLDIAIQELTVEKNKQELDLAQKEANRLEKLVQKGSASREDFEKKTAEVGQRTLMHRSSQEEVKRLKTAFTLNKAKAQASLDSARANLKYYQASIDLDSLGKSLDQARVREKNSVVTSPANGQVLQIHTQPGEVVRNPGILTMANLKKINVIAEVYESDLLRIKEGQRATITATALAKPLSGRVTLVGRLIKRQTVFNANPTAATDARVGDVWIRLDDAEQAARLINLQVTVQIDVAPKAGMSQTGSKGPSVFAPSTILAGRNDP